MKINVQIPSPTAQDQMQTASTENHKIEEQIQERQNEIEENKIGSSLNMSEALSVHESNKVPEIDPHVTFNPNNNPNTIGGT